MWGTRSIYEYNQHVAPQSHSNCVYNTQLTSASLSDSISRLTIYPIESPHFSAIDAFLRRITGLENYRICQVACPVPYITRINCPLQSAPDSTHHRGKNITGAHHALKCVICWCTRLISWMLLLLRCCCPVHVKVQRYSSLGRASVD